VPNFAWDFGNESTPQRPQLKQMNRTLNIKSTQFRKAGNYSKGEKGLQKLPDVGDS
jgi:hypothetical protein